MNTRVQVTLYHYTCDHGRKAIGDFGHLLPASQLTTKRVPWTGEFVWLTDLDSPAREGLGLTSNFIACDRTRHRYRVTDNYAVARWMLLRQYVPREVRDQIEDVPGVLPVHWFVSTEPVRVEYDPIPAAVTA